MARTFEWMGGHTPVPSGDGTPLDKNNMQATSDKKSPPNSPNSHLKELGITLPSPPTPLGAYVESSDTGNLLFLSGTLPIVNHKLAISGRLGENLSVTQGQEAA